MKPTTALALHRRRGTGRRRSAPLVAAALALGTLLLAGPPAAAAADPARSGGTTRKVAIVLFEGVELLDFAGPGEVFASAASIGADGGRPAFEVFTVGVSSEPLLSQGFVRIVPQYTIANSPRPDILIIPGGDVAPLRRSPAFMSWLRASAAGAEVTMSVCTGAFVLAQAGLLDGREATTYYRALEALQAETPKARVQGGRRFVDNGRVVTTAGVSAGIDGALHLVARLSGRETAERAARYMEYQWTPPAAAGTPAGDR